MYDCYKLEWIPTRGQTPKSNVTRVKTAFTKNIKKSHTYQIFFYVYSTLFPLLVAIPH